MTTFEELKTLYQKPSPNIRRPVWVEAIELQDAVNLSAVVRKWAEVQEMIHADARVFNEGTQFVNFHPLNIMYACKVAFMTNQDSWYEDAYRIVSDQVRRLT